MISSKIQKPTRLKRLSPGENLFHPRIPNAMERVTQPALLLPFPSRETMAGKVLKTRKV
jgi:hypothetical protein